MSSELLIEFLKVDEVPCPRCGHTLRGIDTDRCPACDVELHLRVGSIDLRLAPWITAFVGCSIAPGLWVFVFVALTLTAIEAGGPALESERQLIAITTLAGVMWGGGLAGLFRMRSRFFKLTHFNQWMISVALILSCFACFGLAFQLIRDSWG